MFINIWTGFLIVLHKMFWYELLIDNNLLQFMKVFIEFLLTKYCSYNYIVVIYVCIYIYMYNYFSYN